MKTLYVAMHAQVYWVLLTLMIMKGELCVQYELHGNTWKVEMKFKIWQSGSSLGSYYSKLIDVHWKDFVGIAALRNTVFHALIEKC